MDNTPTYRNKIEDGFIGQKMIVLSPDRITRIEESILGKSLYPSAIGYYPHALFHERHRKTGSEQYILLYCVSGKGWIRINNEEFILSAHSYYILEKNIPHSYGSSLKEPWSIYWVHFTGEMADMLYERFATSVNTPPAIPYDPANINTFNQIFNLSENYLGAREIELLYIRLLQFLSVFVYTNQNSTPQEDDPIALSINFMKNNLEKNFSIKELATMANYSISRYSEIFKNRTGSAPIQYFLQLKIQKSCQYLFFTKMTIKEICKEIGFDDQYYFSRMFRKQMGISPMQCRKQYKA